MPTSIRKPAGGAATVTSRIKPAGVFLLILGGIGAYPGALAQDAPPDPNARPPASLYPMDRLLHDWGGMWVSQFDFAAGRKADETVPIPLRPAYQKRRDEVERLQKLGGFQLNSGESRCVPTGMPRMMMDSPFEFVFRPHSIGILSSGHGVQIRNIWLDRKTHTPDQFLFDSFGGESIGHFEGDTLVVDTIGLYPINEILYALKAHRMTITERLYKTGLNTMDDQMVISDPVALIHPWKVTLHLIRTFDQWASEANYCLTAFDRSVDRNGREGLDLTPPPEPGIGIRQPLPEGR